MILSSLSELGMLSTESSEVIVCSYGPGFTSISPHSNSINKIHSEYKEVNVHINTVGYVVIEILNIFPMLGKICTINLIYGTSTELSQKVIKNDEYNNG